MAADTTLPLSGFDDFEDPVPNLALLAADRPRRPAPPSRGPASWLRRLIGVREDVLDWGPEERTRYTWYGAIVVNTALLGGVSMALALATVRADVSLPVRIVVAAAWFWVVLALDSWLVSSTHGKNRWRLLALLPRLALSVLLSLFIAEPILMQIFDSEIGHQIIRTNDDDVKANHSRLVTCNPLDGTDTSARPDCQGFLLQVSVLSPATLRGQVAENGAAVKEMQDRVNGINAALKDKMNAEQAQCARDHWIWWNGYADVSQTCKDIRNDIKSYQQSSNVTAFQGRLDTLTQQGLKLTEQARTADADYKAAMQKAIDDKSAKFATEHDSQGLLTRADALEKVASASWFAAFIAVLLHLILVVVDAMPVLAKLLNGPTEYDKMLTRRMEENHRQHAEDVGLERDSASAERDYERYRRTEHAAHRKRGLEQHYRLEQEELARKFRAELDARAARYRRASENAGS